MSDDRLARQLAFLLEADRLKEVERRTRLIESRRRENSAEHSWHLALFTLVLQEWADEPIDLRRVLAMVLLHDLVEIDAGDTFAYDTVGEADRAERERAAANRLFGLLPADQGAELRALWEEYEAAETPDGRFAKAVDRMQPVMLNLASAGGTWHEHGITLDRVVARNAAIADGSAALWDEVRARLDAAVDAGHIARGDAS